LRLLPRHLHLRRFVPRAGLAHTVSCFLNTISTSISVGVSTSILLAPLRSISGLRYMLFVLSRSVLRAGVFFSLTAVSLSTALVHMGSRGVYGRRGVFCRGLAQRHVRASATFFSSCRHGGFFLFLSLSLSLRYFLSFFFGAISLSLSLICTVPAPPASCGYVAAVGGQSANDVYERNVNGISVA
jgi:hypothetical protein